MVKDRVLGRALCCLAMGTLLLPRPGAAGADAGITVRDAATGLALTVGRGGAYTVTARNPAWTFGGDLGAAPANLAIGSGRDRLGPYAEISFDYRSCSPVHAGLRLYRGMPVVLFSLRYPAGSRNCTLFPSLRTLPRGLYHVSHGGDFAVYSFNTLYADSPALFFNASDQAFIISPAANFLLARLVRTAGGGLAGGIDPAIGSVHPGFTQQTVLVLGQGINRVYGTWGAALLALQGKSRPANDADAGLRYLGYWTDRGAAYYYNYDHSKGYAGTLLAVRRSFDQHGLHLGYVQLDSWWYPKGPAHTWQGSGYLRGGISTLTADPTLFPAGLQAFHRQLGLPLIVHARWIDPSSPYRRRYRISGNVSIDPAYWRDVARYLSSSGVVTYEQDWLARLAVPQLNLRDPGAFMDTMARSMRARGLTMQYSLASARHYLQSTLYSNLTSIRVSPDHFQRDRWDAFLYDSRLASALGIWPWSDVFASAETANLLLSTLSAGIVGVGDSLGAFDWQNLSRAARPDGVIVKPDAAIVPVDASYIADASGADRPMVASTFSDHGSLRALYLVAYRRPGSRTTTATVRPRDLGLAGRIYLYDYFAGTGEVADGNRDVTLAVRDWSYRIAVPIGPSGLAFLGDLGKFASLGRQRIAQLADDGQLRTTIAFAAGERSLIVSGYAPAPPVVRALQGSVAGCSYSAATHLFRVTVGPAAGRSATIAMAPGPAQGAYSRCR